MRRRQLLKSWKLWGALVICLLITLGATHIACLYRDSLHRHRFGRFVTHGQMDIVNRLDRISGLLRGTQGHFAASENVTEDEWQRFIRYTRLLEHSPSVRGIVYAKTASDGSAPASNDQPPAVVAHYVFGNDITIRTGDDVREVGTIGALLVDAPQPTRVSLSQPWNEHGEEWCAMAAPVCQHLRAVPAGLPDKDDFTCVDGWVIAIVSRSELIRQASFANEMNLDLSWPDATDEPGTTQTRSIWWTSVPTFTADEPIRWAGSEWMLRVQTTPAFFGTAESRIPITIFCMGLLTSFFVMAYVVERRRAEHRLHHQTMHDALTGLPNRVLLRDRVEQCIRRAKRDPDYRFAVLFLDLDHFKLINDSLGHAAGDQLLRRASEQLLGAVRAVDTVARMGGDEFTLVLDGVESHADAVRVAQRVQRLLSQPCHFGDQEVFTSVSVGIAMGDAASRSVDDLLRDADTAMYRAKSNGRSTHELFDNAMRDEVIERLQLENDLRRVIFRDELLLNYQPIVGLESGEVTGFEALVRWNHPQRGMVSPAEFIPLAEETGQIVPIGAWVLQEACRRLAQWQKDYPGRKPLTMAVNVSKRQLAEPRFVDDVETAVKSTGIRPSTLVLEVTESMVAEDETNSVQTLNRLKQLGVRIHMDDFGTGTSSLSCLHRLPLDGLKIDRSFIDQMGADNQYVAIVGAVITLARNLQMEVVAEGIETAEQMAQLQAMDCDHGQGFFIARPLPREKVEEFLGVGRGDLSRTA